MSDYLNNLVARTLNFAPVVQPRLASLFESGSAAAGMMRRGPVETETHANFSSGKSKSQEPSAVSPNVQASQMRAQLTEKIEVNLHRESPDTRQNSAERTDTGAAAVHHLSASSANDEPREPIAFRPASPEPETVRSHQQDRGPASHPPAAANVSHQVLFERDREETWPLLQPRIQQLVDERLTRFQPERVAVDERAKSAQSSPVAVSTSLKSPRPPEVIPMRPAPHFLREPVANEPEPTINVTIGRIDVRAIVSQPPSAPLIACAPQRTTSSLEEYLKRRSEGRR